MQGTFNLFVFGAIGLAAEIDCTGFAPWSAEVSGNPPSGKAFKVHKDSKGYTASTWITAADVPGANAQGSWTPWTELGECRQGTMGSGASAAEDPSLPKVDCTDYVPWTTNVSGSPDAGQTTKVYKDGLAYDSSSWVDATTVPGVASGGYTPWTLKGKCQAGTMGTGLAGPGTIDCGQVYAWSPYITYAKEGQLVYQDDQVFKAAYWNNGQKPGTSEVWKRQGKCVTGSASLGPEQDIPVPPQWKLDLTCKCCKACGTVQNGQVVCTDVTQDKCWYKWCGDSADQDKEACEYAKNHEQFAFWNGKMLPSKKQWPKQVYAPYFDSGLYGWPPLSEIVQKYGVKYFIVAFGVSASSPILKTGKCQAAFAGAISLEAGPTYEHEGKFSYLYDELNKVRELGGDFVISFGGANGIELADSAECQQSDPVANLVAEYGRVLDLTNSNRIDFDIEGNAYAAIQKDKGWTYRFNAVKELKRQRPDLHVIWTLPVLPTGLTLDGVSFFELMMQMDAPFDLVNVMNMDYGECPTICDNDHIDKCERDAIDNLTQQLFDTAKAAGRLEQYGWTTVEDVYPFVGSTPMVGKNDITCLTYTLEAAKTNLPYWKQKKVGLIANWSIARDNVCPGSQSVDVACSSYDGQTEQFEFLKLWSSFTSE